MIGYAPGTTACQTLATSPCYVPTYDDHVLYMRTREFIPFAGTIEYVIKCDATPESSPPFAMLIKTNMTSLQLPLIGAGDKIVGNRDLAFVHIQPNNNPSIFPVFVEFDSNLQFKRLIGILAIDEIRAGTSTCAYPANVGGLPQAIYSQFLSNLNPGAGTQIFRPVYRFNLASAPIVTSGHIYTTTGGVQFPMDVVQPVYEKVFDPPPLFNQTQGDMNGDSGVLYAQGFGKMRVTIPLSEVYHEAVSPLPFARFGGTGIRFYTYSDSGQNSTGNINPKLEIRTPDLQVKNGIYSDGEIKQLVGLSPTDQKVVRILNIGGV